MANKNLKDHRQIGQELDLYSFHDVAPGAVFWHQKGYLIYRLLQDFLREKLLSNGYQEIFTLEVEKETYALKPMNCPEACLVYSSKVRSYHDLPLRLADFGVLHRNELSGVLGGLFRV